MSRVLEGQRAIVTGGSSGIGAAVCRAFASAGAVVGINHLPAPEHAEAAAAIADELVNTAARVTTLPANVSVEADVVAMFDRFQGDFGGVDIVVANAGIQEDAPFAELSLEQWQAVIDVNLTGQFLCVREAVRRFQRQEAGRRGSRAIGKVICMSSVHELIPWAGHVNYAASKSGVRLMMKSVAQEVARHGIRVNSIAPGAIRTDINRQAWETAEARRRLLELIPYGRVGTPEDVARAAVWLASDDSDYVTGATLFVDGGMSLFPAFIDNG